MKINEIFLSIQGESRSSGFPTVFVRFAGCNLRCNYCDTTYAYEESSEMSPGQVMDEIRKYQYQRVCLTGGEPLLQDELNDLLELLADFTVTIETNGSVAIDKAQLKGKHSYVMDIKTPSSGCSDRNLWRNLNHITDRDEIKFVIGDRRDYEWSRKIVCERIQSGVVSFSPVYGKMDAQQLIGWILEDRLNVCFQLQLHKLIWGPSMRGV